MEEQPVLERTGGCFIIDLCKAVSLSANLSELYSKVVDEG
jgi:hypothetical protein